MTDAVLVVGAGPVGLTLACELARYRIQVRIIDTAPQRTDKSKALVVWTRTLELLERGRMAQRFVQAGVKTQAMQILSRRGRIARIDFTGLQSPYPFALMLPQSETERLLETRLAELGVTVERQTTLENFSETGAGVSCVLRDADGRQSSAEVAWLVGCDGAHSTVRKQLGLSFGGDTMPQSFILADLYVVGLPLSADEAAIYWSAQGFLLYFPIGPGRCRIIADVGEEPRHDPELPEVQAIVDARGPGGVSLADPIWMSGFTINERMVPTYRAGRVFVAGDAAHVHSPAGGQGMNTGMQDAINLAWKLALVAEGLAAPSLLDTYSAERAGVARQVLAESGRLTRAAMIANPLEQDLRNFVTHIVMGFRPIQHRVAIRLSELFVGYPNSPLNHGHVRGKAGPAPGQRYLAQEPFGAGDQPRFALCAPDDAQTRAFLAEHPRLVEAEPRAIASDGAMRLIRPDGYVAAVAKAGDWQVLQDCMAMVRSGKA
jgi:2-polyprenyl-6-methoxyphenol hydroxylase-like FAD-dependent oxidoreductase